VCEIYNHYIKNTIITFEEEIITVKEIQNRIKQSGNLPWIVYEEDGKILGYAYAGQWKNRTAFKYSAEITVYLEPSHFGKGIGSELYSALILKLKETNKHSIIAAISLPNEKSIILHEKFGFKKNGHFHEVGRKFDKWIDVGYWELIL
jgi:phosphinothricin acetyltransferase